MAAPAPASFSHPPALRLAAPPVAAPAAPAARVSGRPPCPFFPPRPSPPSRLAALGTARGSRFFRAKDASRLAAAAGFWEDPDDGYGSEHEEVEGEDDAEELDVEEDEGGMVFAESAGDVPVADASEFDRLRLEVELLLNPEERAILQQNETPNLSKISSVKFLKHRSMFFFISLTSTKVPVMVSCRYSAHRIILLSLQGKWKPFHTRALSGHIPSMDDLLQHGIDFDDTDKDGLTALHKAVIGKKEAVISHLLRKGANPHVRDRDGATPLHYAVQVGAMQTVKLFMKYKVDVNVADTDGWTPLHLAMQSRSRDIAKVLLANGADKTRRNKDGKTPLDLSLCYGKDFKSYELAKLLKLVSNREF